MIRRRPSKRRVTSRPILCTLAPPATGALPVTASATGVSTIKTLIAATIAVICAAAPAAAGCKLLGGIRKDLTEGIAKAMADAAVKNTIETKGLKPTGEIKHTCTSAALGTECTARQQGCK